MRPLAALCSAALLLLLSWWWWSPDAVAPGAEPPAPGPAAPPPLLPGFAPRAEREDSRPADPSRTALALADEGAGEGFDLHVVRADTGEPVPFPSVRIRSYADLTVTEELILDTDGVDYAERALAPTTPWHGDARGRLDLPELGEYTLVEGTAPGLSGQVEVSVGDPRPCVLELAPDRELRILVRDDAGHAVGGVPVVLRDSDTQDDRLFAGWHTAISDDTTGLAVMRHLLRDGPEELAEYDTVVACVPIDPLPRVEFDASRPADVPLELVLPPTGRLEVTVVDPAGRPLIVEALVQVVPSSADLELGAGYAGKPYLPRAATRLVRGGKALFRHVGLGTELTLFARDERGFTALRTEVQGPRNVDEVVRVELPLGVRHALVRGRLLDEAARPCSSRRCRMVLWDLDMHGWIYRGEEHELTTDDGGRFLLPLWNTKELWRWAAVTIFPEAEGGDPVRGANRELSVPLSIGVNDLEDLTLTTPPLIVAGRVIDEEGRPVAGAKLPLFTREEEDPDEGRVPWSELWLLGGATGSDGTFSIHAWNVGPRFALTVEHDGLLPTARVPFARGTSNLEIVVRRSGWIAGDILWGADSSLGDVDIRVVPEAPPPGSEDEEREIRTWIDKRTRGFMVSEVPPGSCSITLLEKVSHLPLFQVEGIEVRAGEVTRDLRLRAIDLRDKVRSITLHVLDPEGQPVAELRAACRSTGTEAGRTWNVRGEDGRLTLLLGEQPVDVRVTAPGLRYVDLEGVDEDRTIALPPGYHLRLEVRQPGLLPAGYRLAASNYGRLFWSPRPSPFAPTGDFRFRASEPGPHRFKLFVEDLGTGRYASLSIEEPDFPENFDVRDTDEEQVLRLDIPPEAILRALEELKRDG